jgi:RNA polymerase sigma factor (sigma-70 family)
MAQADNWSWERYRPLLQLQARQLRLDPRLRPRFDSSDLVQDALTHAWERRNQCTAENEGQRIRWLQEIFRTKAIDRIRAENAANCDPHREQSIHDAFAESSARWDGVLGTENGRPDHEAERREFLVRFAQAMDTLAKDRHDAVLLVRVMRVKLSEAAETMGRTEKSVSGLVRRGLDDLAALLPEFKPSNL